MNYSFRDRHFKAAGGVELPITPLSEGVFMPLLPMSIIIVINNAGHEWPVGAEATICGSTCRPRQWRRPLSYKARRHTRSLDAYIIACASG